MQIVDEVARIAPDEFDPEGGVPVVIEHAIADWPALARWSPEYLSARIGDVRIKYKVSANGQHPNFHAASLKEMFATETATIRDFVAEVAADASGRKLFTGDEKFVLRRRDGVTSVDPELAPLLDDVHIPRWIPNDSLYTIWSWFSGANVRTWLHYDNNDCHNLNAQITGEKTCILIHPDQTERVALFPRGGANPATNCSQTDVFAPDLARFPAFADVRALGARLAAGDLLYIPALWLHAFEHLGAFNTNINFWWKPVTARS
jgi:hypothetical protein